jgi:hypothetical protein
MTKGDKLTLRAGLFEREAANDAYERGHLNKAQLDAVLQAKRRIHGRGTMFGPCDRAKELMDGRE